MNRVECTRVRTQPSSVKKINHTSVIRKNLVTFSIQKAKGAKLKVLNIRIVFL